MITLFGEKRKYKRLDIAVPILLRVVKSDSSRPVTRAVEGRLCDLTPAGARVMVGAVVVDGLHLFYDVSEHTGRVLEVTIEMPDGSGVITLQGRITWYNVTEGDFPFRFGFGVEILDISREERERLHAFLFRMKKTLQGLVSDGS